MARMHNPPHPGEVLEDTVLRDMTVTELAKPFEMSLPGVSKHLKVLQTAGLVVQGRDAQWRPCRLDPERLRDVAGYLEQYRQLWEGRLERLDEYLRELQRQDATPDEPQTT